MISVCIISHKKLENTLFGLLKAIPGNIQSRREVLESSLKNYSDYKILSELFIYMYAIDECIALLLKLFYQISEQ